MTFTKAIIAVSLAAVVIAAPAAQPQNVEPKLQPEVLSNLLNVIVTAFAHIGVHL
ncbi:hypothetical protein H4582DRAFT_2084001 [Lactarius indigo]|nr:hypothetical protein H4582DRAFT_2084001 [Lactarius indigo]